MHKLLPTLALAGASTLASAAIGPLPIYLSTEFRTSNEIIAPISNTRTIDSDDIAGSGVKTFTELLKTIPEANVFDAVGNIPTVFMRGSNSHHTLVLINGVKIQDISATFNLPALDAIPLDNIERIEIIKGSSVLYGSGAIGGVINIITKEQGSNTTSLHYGTHNTSQTALSLSATEGDTTLHLSLSQYETDGVSALKNNEERDGLEQRTLQLNAASQHGDMRVGVDISTLDSITEYDDAFGFGGFNHDKYFDKSLHTISLFSESDTTNIRYSIVNQQKKSFTNGVIDTFNDKRYRSKDLTLLHDINFEDTLVTLGINHLHDENLSDNFSLTSRDIFTNMQYQYSNIDTNIGLRTIDNSKFGHEFIYDIGVGISSLSGLRYTAKYATAYTAPNLYQLFDGFSGNENLQPEQATNIELGVRKEFAWGDVNLGIYKIRVEDYIDAPAPTFVYGNQGTFNSQGVLIDTEILHNGYTTNIYYQYNKAYTDESSEQALRRAKNTLGVSIAKQYGKIFSRASWQVKSKRRDTNNLTLGGYSRVDIHSRYALMHNNDIVLNINNLFDKEYEDAGGYNITGRTFELGFTYNF